MRNRYEHLHQILAVGFILGLMFIQMAFRQHYQPFLWVGIGLTTVTLVLARRLTTRHKERIEEERQAWIRQLTGKE